MLSLVICRGGSSPAAGEEAKEGGPICDKNI